MNEEIDEYEFYHQDFTTASEWEVLIARLEEIIVEWNLSKIKLCKSCPESTKKWIEKSEDIKFRGLNFTLSYNALESAKNQDIEKEPEEKCFLTEIQQSLWESTTNFMDNVDGSPFPVSNWFGLKRYLMLYPKAPLVDGSLIKLIMSSVSIAFSIVDCGIPFFVKIREHWQHTYLGIFEDNDYKISFDVIHLKRISNQCSHLNGLVGLFKSKISSPVPLDAVVISTKYSYELKDSDSFKWRKLSYINDFLSIDGSGMKKSTELPFGSETNPLQSALLNAIWPHFRESAIVDSSTFSDIDPIMAPTWTITIKLKNNINYLLEKYIGKVMSFLDKDTLIMDVLGLSRSLGLENPLNKITEAPVSFSKLVQAASTGIDLFDIKEPLSDILLMPILYYIFPDAAANSNFPYPEPLEIESKKDGTEIKLCGYVKTSPVDGLVWRLSVFSARLIETGGMRYLAHFWYEFTQELQYRWQHRILVPGVAEGAPNARTCLLHQKLQLLNCCIKRAQEGSAAAGYSSDEEFFDCSDNEGAEDHLPWDRPVGRLHRLDNITLKNGAPLYVPRTQDPAPKTEDQLEEDAELMVRLGDDAKASQLRAKMMSASLLSDMESFKAANPGAELCDFVHWYSPRDWKPDDGGSLGDRMLLPGNPWVEAWDVARPVPAARQRRLFDETLEAAQVLYFLRSRTIAGVVELVLPAILRAGALKAISEGAPSSSTTIGVVDKRRTFEIAARELIETEREVCRSNCVRKVLGDSAEGQPLDVAGRSRVLDAMGGSLPAPVFKEFTLKVKDEVGPQVMRAALSNEMTIIGAFTERIVCL